MIIITRRPPITLAMSQVKPSHRYYTLYDHPLVGVCGMVTVRKLLPSTARMTMRMKRDEGEKEACR